MPIKPGVKIPKVKGKTKSQTLRAVIYLYQEQLGSVEDKESFYNRHMDNIIAQYQEKLSK